MPALAPGAYRLEWRVISGDGHPISGDFVFFVGAGAGAEGRPADLGTPPPPSAGGPGSHEAAGRAPAGGAASGWLMVTRAGADAAVLLLAGLLMFGSLGGGVPSARTATVTLALSAAAPALVAVYAWLWTGSVLGPDTGSAARIDALASLFTGRALTAELVLVAFAPWALLLARRPRLAMVFAGAAILAGAFAGHAASYTPVVSVPASALHQLAAATWLGGLLFLVTEAESPVFADAARRVSGAALAAVAVVTLTGLLQSWLLVDTITRALSTPYGLLLLGKAAGLLGLVAFGAYHRFRVMPHVASPDGAARLSRSVRMELALAVGVVTLAAVLSHVPPNP
jgi:putative copper export protein